MKILVIGNHSNLDECQKKFGDKAVYTHAEEHDAAQKFIGKSDVVFDFIIDESPHEIELYADEAIAVFLNTCKITLTELAHLVDHQLHCVLFGFNGLPTLLNRNSLEVSLYRQQDLPKLQEVCGDLGTEFLVCDDRVGLVTPRVVCMIINEAYYTVQEGTATREDIDLAMKLGTNYPFGPFEWCERIGVHHVYDVLEALYDDTKDERYKICPLLKKEYLRQV